MFWKLGEGVGEKAEGTSQASYCASGSEMQRPGCFPTSPWAKLLHCSGPSGLLEPNLLGSSEDIFYSLLPDIWGTCLIG